MFHCYICEKLLIVYVYACFGGSPAGEADKIGKKKIKKNLMFLVAPQIPEGI
jgi:hypothetical protein